MATKAGKVQLKDIRQGKTFYQVYPFLTFTGKINTEIIPVYCVSIPRASKIYRSDYYTFIPKYPSEYLIYVVAEYKRTRQTLKENRLEAMFAFCYNLGPEDLRYKADRININRWLFTTRKHAEKFAEDFKKTYQIAMTGFLLPM